MPAIIHPGRCDQAEECTCPTVCAVDAWIRKNNKWFIDNSKCTTCGLCANECPAEAVLIAKTDEGLERLKKQIENDREKSTDLFVDRYGAMPIHSNFHIFEDNFNDKIIKSSTLVVAELFNDNSIQCLRRSIPIKELFKGKFIDYKKVDVKDSTYLLKKYKIKKLPCLLFFRNKKLLGKIEGYYKLKSKVKIIRKIKNII